MDPEDFPKEPMPTAPAHHNESSTYDCQYGWILGEPPRWGECDCEDPANPWPPRALTDGPVDCSCGTGCSGHQPRVERGRLESCEYRDHHCDTCHAEKICTTVECGFGRQIDLLRRIAT